MNLLDRTWRRIFLLELPLCLGTALYWLLTPDHYVAQAYDVALADVGHVGLLRQLAGVLVSLLVWTYGRWLLSAEVELRPFRFLQEGLALGDVFILAGAGYAFAQGEISSTIAVGQSIPAAIWLAIRVVFLVRTGVAEPARLADPAPEA